MVLPLAPGAPPPEMVAAVDSIDTVTLSFAATVDSVVFLLVPLFLMLVVDAEDRRGLRYWVAGAAALAAATIVGALSLQSGSLEEVIVVNSATVLGLGWMYLAIQRLLDYVGPRWPVYAASLAVAANSWLWTAASDNAAARLSINAVVLATFPVLTVVLLWRRRSMLGTTLAIAAAGAFVVTAAAFLGRAVALATPLRRDTSEAALEAVGALPLIIELVFTTWTGAVLAVIVSARIQGRLRTERDRVALMNEQLQILSTTDPLTGLANRNRTDEVLGVEVRRASSRDVPVSVVLLDVDHFKAINDEFGHPVGDEVLVAAAGCLLETVRETDVVGRWGGEEFLVVLTGTGSDESARVAERLRSAVAGSDFSVPRPVTVSLGTTSYRAGDDAASLVARADQLLYRAKREGRNRVVAG